MRSPQAATTPMRVRVALLVVLCVGLLVEEGSADRVTAKGFGACKGMFLNEVPPDSVYPYNDDTYVKLCKTYGDGKPLFAALFNKKLRISEWVAYTIKYQESTADRDCNWARDDEIKALEDADKEVYQAKDSDYTKSGYQRGHLLPASSCSWSTDSICATFQFSNCVPQNGPLNRMEWVYTEYLVRNYVHTLWQDGNDDDVYVVTGVNFTTKKPKLMKGKIAIPDGMFTTLYHPEGNKGFGVYAENKGSQPVKYQGPSGSGYLKLHSIEALEGILGRNVLADAPTGCFFFCTKGIAKDSDPKFFLQYQSKTDPYSVGDLNECKEFCDHIMDNWCEGKKAKQYCKKVGSFFSEKRARCSQYAMVMHRGDVADQILGEDDKGDYNFKPKWAELCKGTGVTKKKNSLCGSNGFCSLATFRSPNKVKGAVEKEGFLWKKSWKTFSFSRGMHRRYFVLDHSSLKVYESDKQFENSPERPKHSVSLNIIKDDPGVEAIEDVSPNGKWCFRIVTTDGGRYSMCADTKKERNEWVTALKSHEKQFYPTGLPIAAQKEEMED